MPQSPFDVAIDPPAPVNLPVVILLVGLIFDEPDVEVLARSMTEPPAFYRFLLPRHARVVRQFWRAIGVKDVSRLQEGAYQSAEGVGPFALSGTAVGLDTPDVVDPDEDVVQVGTTVLVDTVLRG